MSASSASSGGSGLLLRLFESDFFNVHLAVAYLKHYPDSIGITYYLIARLSQYSEEEIDIYWPQLCHLLISRPTQSAALEGFILRKCEESTHLAMKTLWYIQASLSDLSSTPTTPSFAVCRRVFNKVQGIVFPDPIKKDPVPDPTSPRPSVGPSKVEKVTGGGLAAAVGMGLVLGSVGLPSLPREWGRVAIEQGRRGTDVERERKAVAELEELVSRPSEGESSSGEDEGGRDNSASGKETPRQGPSKLSHKPGISGRGRPRPPAPPPDHTPGRSLVHPPTTPPTPQATSSTGPRSRAMRGTHSSTLTRKESENTFRRSPATRMPPMSGTARKSRPAAATTIHVNAPSASTSTVRISSGSNRVVSQSVPFLPYSQSTVHLSPYSPLRVEPAALYPPAALRNVLRSYAMKSQLDLLTSLQDISTRLVVVPKMARLSALRAELTVLNHGLPMGCCLGMYCKGEGGGPATSSWLIDESRAAKPDIIAHHRIVRISPNESVVLNSADRAPFLIHVEILEGDLDFDPTRRQNAEDLRRALGHTDSLPRGFAFGNKRHNENGHTPRGSLDQGLASLKSSGSRSTSPLGPPSPIRRATVADASPNPAPPTSSYIAEGDALSPPQSPDTEVAEPATSIRKRSAEPYLEPPVPEEPEEMDLVEQLYGSSSLREVPEVDGEYDSFMPPIQNRAIDEAAWKRAAEAKRRPTSLSHRNSVSLKVPPTTLPTNGGPVGPGAAASSVAASSKPGKRQPITLDEYAERMRMAAIMLAQLNASEQFGGASGSSAGSAAGQLVGGALGLGASVGVGIGGAVGAGLGAVVNALNPTRRDSTGGQASSGLTAKLDTTHAASGHSAVAGTSPLPTGTFSNADDHSGSRQSTSSVASSANPQTQSRQRVLSPQESQAIKDRIMTEMMGLEEERMERMRMDSLARSSGWTTGKRDTADEAVVMRAINKDDPSGSMLGETWAEKRARIRAASPYGHLVNWDVLSCIVKTGADLRQEQLVTQLIKEFGRIWSEEGCPVWVRYYRILVTGESTGLMETIVDAVSLHSLKKAAYSRIRAANAGGVLPTYTMYDYYVETFGDPKTSSYSKAQDAFLKSFVAYSIISYLLQLKDRHNGNILIDKVGHIIHIDFGFVLSNSPGSIGFEMAPFKLSQEYIDILGGFESDKWTEFRELFKRAFRDIRKHAERIITIVELMQHDSRLPCFGHGEATTRLLRERFQLGLTSTQCDDFADKLILSSAGSVFTKLYDSFQYYSQGVL